MIPKIIIMFLLIRFYLHRLINKTIEPMQTANTAIMIKSIIKGSSSLLFWIEAYHIYREDALNIL